MKYFTLIVLMIALMLATGSTSSASEGSPFSRVVIILDASGTFRGRISEALLKVQELVAALESQRTTRRDTPDEIYILRLDGAPKVIWAGNRLQLDQLTPEMLQAAFGPATIPDCTDVGAAFNLAQFKLDAAPAPMGKYIFAFSDLLDEPVSSGGRKCVPLARPSLPPRSVDWKRLSDVSILGLWVDDREIRAWSETLGIPKNIKLLDEAQSRNSTVAAIPKATRKLTESDLAIAKQSVASTLWNAGVVILALGATVIVVGMLGTRAARARKRRQPAQIAVIANRR